MKILNTTTTVPTPPTTQLAIRQRLKGHTLTVEMSAEEAWFILACVRRVGGGRFNSIRQYETPIAEAITSVLAKIMGRETALDMTDNGISGLSGTLTAKPFDENP